LADEQKELQQQVSQLHTSSSRFGMNISTSKTKVQCILKQPMKPTVSKDEAKLNQVEQLIYLGGVIYADAHARDRKSVV